MAWQEALGGVAGSVGDYLSDRKSDRNVRDINNDQMSLSRDQMAFQERMSSSAHMREVEDLRNAGLNPILSANSGASTPSGSMPSLNVPNPPSFAGRFLSGVRDAMRFAAELKEAKSRTDLNKQLENTSDADGKLKTEQANLTSAQGRIAERNASISDAITPTLRSVLDGIFGKGGVLNSAKEGFRLRAPDTHDFRHIGREYDRKGGK